MCPRLPSWRGPGTPRPPRRARFRLAIRGATCRGHSSRPGPSPRCPRCLGRRPAHACAVGLPGLRTGLSAWAGGGAWGCSFPQDSPTQLWGAVESACVSAGLSRTEGPWHPLHHQGKLGPWSQRKWTAALAMHGADADMGEKQRGTRVAGPRPRRARRKGRAP